MAIFHGYVSHYKRVCDCLPETVAPCVGFVKMRAYCMLKHLQPPAASAQNMASYHTISLFPHPSRHPLSSFMQNTHTHTHTYIYIYIYIFFYICIHAIICIYLIYTYIYVYVHKQCINQYTYISK